MLLGHKNEEPRLDAQTDAQADTNISRESAGSHSAAAQPIQHEVDLSNSSAQRGADTSSDLAQHGLDSNASALQQGIGSSSSSAQLETDLNPATLEAPGDAAASYTVRTQEPQGEVDWEMEQGVERRAVAAAQQLAQDNSQALREVRQAMQQGR